jgi:hypothetical protein
MLSNPQKMLESVMMLGSRKRVFLRSTLRRGGGMAKVERRLPDGLGLLACRKPEAT